MKPSQSGVARSGIGGGRASLSMPAILYKAGCVSNQSSFQEVAGRTEGVVASLRSAVEQYAASLLDVIPVGQRSRSETAFLLDCQRGRRPFNAENVARLLVLASRTNAPLHGLSECIRSIEVQMAEAKPLCAFEASQSETIAQGQLDQAQMLAQHEDTPTRWTCVAEVGRTHMDALRRVVDSAVKRASLLSARNHA